MRRRIRENHKNTKKVERERKSERERERKGKFRLYR